MPAAAHALILSERESDHAGRGACVPFETPALFAARVRGDDRHGMSLLLRNFAAGGAVYVLPWDAAPQTIPMTARDRALHHAVAASRALTPRAVRSAVRSVAVAGLAGPDAARAARAAQQEESLRAAELQAALIVRVLHAHGLMPDVPGDRLPRLDLSATPAALRAAAGALRMAPERLFATTETASRLLLPVGLATTPAPAPSRPARAAASSVVAGLADDGRVAGPLRRLHGQLTTFSRHLRERKETAPPETRGYYDRAETAAAEAITLGGRALGAIDAALAQPGRLLARWDAEQTRIAAEIDRLFWVLDGWEPTIDHYTHRLADLLLVSQEQTLAVLAAVAPPPGRRPAA